MTKHWLLIAAIALMAAGCAKKAVAPQPVAGETAKAGAKLAYEHQLSIQMPQEQIAPRVAAVREACESARFGACDVLRIEQSEHDATLIVRVVPAGVEALSGMASQNGKVASRRTQAEDLAEAINDNDQKLRQLQAYSAQVDQLAQRKDLSTADLLALGHERAQIQVDSENLQNAAAQQQRRVDTNLLQMDFTDESGGHRFGASLSGWTDQLYDGVSDALSMLAYGVPFLLLAFPLALGWWWFWRRVTRKGRERDVR